MTLSQLAGPCRPNPAFIYTSKAVVAKAVKASRYETQLLTLPAPTVSQQRMTITLAPNPAPYIFGGPSKPGEWPSPPYLYKS